MINTELLNDGTLIKHYSDSGLFLMQNETSIMYAEAIDIIPCPYTYTETDLPIEVEDKLENEEELEQADELALNLDIEEELDGIDINS